MPLAELERYEQAVAWREQSLPLIREALTKLHQARSACPSSLEVAALDRAIKSTLGAVKECERSLVVARKMVTREKRRL